MSSDTSLQEPASNQVPILGHLKSAAKAVFSYPDPSATAEQSDETDKTSTAKKDETNETAKKDEITTAMETTTTEEDGKKRKATTPEQADANKTEMGGHKNPLISDYHVDEHNYIPKKKKKKKKK